MLEPYKGMSNRFQCPDCNKNKKYVRYIDSNSGHHLPYQYGKCERINNCGYHLSPYKDGYHKKNWDFDTKYQTRSFLHRPKVNTVPLSPIYFPDNILTASQKCFIKNALCLFFINKLGREKTTELLQVFPIGTSNYWNIGNATVFWLVDHLGNIHGGQVILYDKFGNTIKKPYRHNSWVHKALIKKYKKINTPIPKWLHQYNIRKGNKFGCLFGLNQLNDRNTSKTIAIVESAKTAIIATAYYPDYIWLAIGSLGYLTEERIRPIYDRNIVFFPDNGGYVSWNKKVQQFNRNGNLRITDFLERTGVEKGADLADYLIQFDWESFQEL